ncbi:MAG TPA: hypothetical protein VFS09_00160 [Candidatus Eisenbacteria bacterium]|nr:hypothetical protein [Candidatus Eisenbacteria bacterium]
MDDNLEEPLDPAKAKRRILHALKRGIVVTSVHARQEMESDAVTYFDCVAVLRSGIVRPGELERGTWRYRVETRRVVVVIAFRSESKLVIVTAWRVKA